MVDGVEWEFGGVCGGVEKCVGCERGFQFVKYVKRREDVVEIDFVVWKL